MYVYIKQLYSRVLSTNSNFKYFGKVSMCKEFFPDLIFHLLLKTKYVIEVYISVALNAETININLVKLSATHQTLLDNGLNKIKTFNLSCQHNIVLDLPIFFFTNTIIFFSSII